jgi:hypothetical protein
MKTLALTVALVAALTLDGAPNRGGSPTYVYPVIEGHGKVRYLEDAVEPPQRACRAVYDITGFARPAEAVKGVDRAATLLNLYGAYGVPADSVRICLIFHGDATTAVLRDEAYSEVVDTPDVTSNPNRPVFKKLRAQGVQIQVCGQALAHRNYARKDVAPEVDVAASAITTLINKQAEGYAFVPYN